MVIWEKYTGDDNAQTWDNSLLTAQDYTVFQSFGWGEYKKKSNWHPLRYWLRDKNGKVQGMAQLLLKSLPLGVDMLWAPGGPVFIFQNNSQDKVTELLQYLLMTVRIDHPRSVIRFHSHLQHNSALSYNLNKVCLRPFIKLNSGYSIHLNLGLQPELARQKMTSKHRYYTKKATEANIRWSVGNSNQHMRDFTELHSEMTSTKQLASIATSYAEIECMRNMLGDNVIVVTGYLNDIPVTSCLVLLFGCKAFYMMASTGKRGREVNAAYAMFERLMQELNVRGITHFDFGGIDPVNPVADGVNHFKRGFGGQVVEYLGEWEYASSELLRLGINFALRLRGGRV